MTITEASEKYNINKSTIYEWIYSGKINPRIKTVTIPNRNDTTRNIKAYDISTDDIIRAREKARYKRSSSHMIKDHYGFHSVGQLAWNEYRSELNAIFNRRTVYTKTEKCLGLY